MIEIQIKGISLQLESDPALFSPRKADEGTLLMLDHIDFHPDDKVLDLGCGYGIVGILAAKILPPEQVYMTDTDALAVKASRANLKRNSIFGVTVSQGDAYEDVPCADFTLILSNPPYHTDFSVAKTFIEKGFNRLSLGGRLFMVTRRKDWYRNKLISIFGGVQIWEKNGYYVFASQKNSRNYAAGKDAK